MDKHDVAETKRGAEWTKLPPQPGFKPARKGAEGEREAFFRRGLIMTTAEK